MKGRPFAHEPIAEILADVPHGGMEDRSLARDYLIELDARVRKVLALIDDIEPPGLGLHPDEPACSLCQVKAALLRILNGEE